MLIIIEGPDCAGKTTLAKAIHDHIQENSLTSGHIIMRHAKPPKAHPLDEYVTPLTDYRPGLGDHVILDRWHWGEAIYPQLLHRDTVMDRAVFIYIEKFLRARGALVVTMNPSVSALRERMANRGDDSISPMHLTTLHMRYKLLQGKTKLHTIDGIASTPQQIVFAARGAERAMTDLSKFVTYVGPRWPRALLLGEMRSNRDRLLVPAFMPFKNTSGYYLMDAIQSLDKDYGIANACDTDDVDELWSELGHPHVVTLGRAAHNKVKMLHAQVPHPQYVRRFYHREGAAYGEIIRKAIETEMGMGDFSSWRP